MDVKKLNEKIFTVHIISRVTAFFCHSLASKFMLLLSYLIFFKF